MAIAKAQLLQFGNSLAFDFGTEVVIFDTHPMTLGGKHSVPGFDQSLEDLRTDILMMAALVRRSLTYAKAGWKPLHARDARFGYVPGVCQRCSVRLISDQARWSLIAQVFLSAFKTISFA
jgi:hypothetical protein